MENGRNFSPYPHIFCYLMLDFYVKTGIRFSLRDKRLFEITEVEITKVDCIRMDNSTCQKRLMATLDVMWQQNFYLYVFLVQMIFPGRGEIGKFENKVSIKPALGDVWTLFFLHTGKDIRMFYLDRQYLSHPCYITQVRIKMLRFYRKSHIYVVK